MKGFLVIFFTQPFAPVRVCLCTRIRGLGCSDTGSGQHHKPKSVLAGTVWRYHCLVVDLLLQGTESRGCRHGCTDR